MTARRGVSRFQTGRLRGAFLSLVALGGAIALVQPVTAGSAPSGVSSAVPHVVSPPGTAIGGISESAVTTLGSIFPDTTGAVSADYIVSAAAGALTVRNRTSNVVQTIQFASGSLWSASTPGTLASPRVVYDTVAQRFVMTAVRCVDCSGAPPYESYLALAYSAPDDPTSWVSCSSTTPADVASAGNPTANDEYLDDPRIGFNTSWIGVSANMYTNGSFTRPALWVFDQSALDGVNCPVASVFDHLDSATFGSSLQPATTFGATAPLYLVNNFSGANGQIKMFEITEANATLTLSVVRTPSASAWADSVGTKNLFPQAGSAARVFGWIARVQSAVVRGGSLWLAQTIFLPAANPTHAAIQWWKLGLDGTVQDRGRIESSVGVSYAYGTIAVNAQGDALIGFSRFSSSTHPSAGYVFRMHSDAPGTFRSPVIYQSGLAPYAQAYSGCSEPNIEANNGCRNWWGTYSATQADPADTRGLTLWTVQEYAAPTSGTGTWSTEWARVNPVPANDDLANARTISGASGSVTVNNTYATEQGAERHGGCTNAPLGHGSVWYAWTAPNKGVLTFDTLGSRSPSGTEPDTLLAGYTGTVQPLHCVAGNDNTPGSDPYLSRVSNMPVVGGVRYLIAVDGFNRNNTAVPFGDLQLNWKFTADTTAPAVHMTRPATGAQLTGTIAVAWSAADNAGGSGLKSYDVERRGFSATSSAAGSWHALESAVTATSFSDTPPVPRRGNSYCYHVRARDAANNVSAWTAPRCAAIPFDAADLTNHPGFTLTSAPGKYGNQQLYAVTAGARISLSSVTGQQLFLVVTKCPSCGTVTVSWQGHNSAVSLQGSPLSSQVIWLPALSVGTGPATLNAGSSTLVEIEGIGVYRG